MLKLYVFIDVTGPNENLHGLIHSADDTDLLAFESLIESLLIY